MEQAKIAFTKLANKIGLRKNPATMWQRRMWAEGIMCNFFVSLIKINTSGGNADFYYYLCNRNESLFAISSVTKTSGGIRFPQYGCRNSDIFL